jgi:glycerol-3-phosphate cytidylyltransferase
VKVGFIASCFDLGPHAGHVQSLKEAKSQCDHLVVALQVDPSRERATKNKPVQSVSERYLTLKACRYVDEVIPYETEGELLELLKLLNPNIRFLGDDYIGKPFTGKELGIQIHYCSRIHSVSSSTIRKLIKGS